jgi:hypothetical protein
MLQVPLSQIRGSHVYPTSWPDLMMACSVVLVNMDSFSLTSSVGKPHVEEYQMVVPLYYEDYCVVRCDSFYVW